MDPCRGARADARLTVVAVAAAVLVVPWTAWWSAERTYPEDVGIGAAPCFPIVVLLDEPAGSPPAAGGTASGHRVGNVMVCGR